MRTDSIAGLVSILAVAALPALAPAQENVWTSHGPAHGGIVNDVAVGEGIVYAATPIGVFRSNDGARTWQPSGLTGEYVDRVITRAGAAVVFAMTGFQLHVSRDAGETWTPVSGPPPTVWTVAIDPGHLATIYLGTTDGIWRSTDSGRTFQRQSDTPGDFSPLSLAFDSHALYVQGYDAVYKSEDGATTWTDAHPPISGVTTLAGSAADGAVYAGTRESLCRSTDSAATWTCATFPEYPYAVVELPGNPPGAPPRVLAVSEDTRSQTALHVSGDGGATWVTVTALPVGYFSVSSLASDEAGSLVLAGTSSGVFSSRDRGESWTPGREGLRSSAITSLASDPHEASTVWASALDLGLFRSADGGLSWSPAAAPPAGTLGAVAIDPEHFSTLYVGTSSGVSRSDDAGAHWTSSVLPDSAIPAALAVDPVSTSNVWAASLAGLFRSDDGARTWSPTSIAQSIYCFLIDEKRPDNIYAGSDFGVTPADFTYPEYPYGGAFFVSRDHGEGFTKLDHDFGSSVRAIAVDPFVDDTLYLGTSSGGVFRSVDGGATWVGASDGLPVNIAIAALGGRRAVGDPGWVDPSPASILRLVADPVRPGRLYCATDRGIFRTIDGASTWQPFSSGLPGTSPISDLVVSPDGRTLHAGTTGGGVFEFDLQAEETSPPSCVASASRLCLVGSRYAVDLLASRSGGNLSGAGTARRLSDRAGFFSLPFATGDPDLPEVAVKMFAEGTFGVGGAPIFYSSLTTLRYALIVTDTLTGRQQVFRSDPDAPLCGGGDLAFVGAEASVQSRSTAAPVANALELLGGRFSVALTARHPRTGQIVSGTTMASGDRFGFFSLPEVTGDPQFPEVVVKMLDAQALDGHFWFFYTGLTSLAYTLTVADSVTGEVRTYDSASPFCGAADTESFIGDPWGY